MSDTTTLIIIAAIIIGAVLYRRYQVAKEQERAAGQWNSVLSLGTTILGFL